MLTAQRKEQLRQIYYLKSECYSCYQFSSLNSDINLGKGWAYGNFVDDYLDISLIDFKNKIKFFILAFNSL